MVSDYKFFNPSAVKSKSTPKQMLGMKFVYNTRMKFTPLLLSFYLLIFTLGPFCRNILPCAEEPLIEMNESAAKPQGNDNDPTGKKTDGKFCEDMFLETKFVNISVFFAIIPGHVISHVFPSGDDLSTIWQPPKA
jgi:hypothetical protein